MVLSRYAVVSPLSVLVALAPGSAYATITDCGVGDAPDAYDNSTCQSVCTESANEVTCLLEPLCPSATYFGAEARAVTNFHDDGTGAASSHDVSIWGSCLGGAPKFCCVFDEGATNIEIIEIQGTDDADEVLGFTALDSVGNRLNLKPWDGEPLEGFIRGLRGGDYIEGSFYAASSIYTDNLYGNRGDDTIYGNAGNDFVSGGYDNDVLYGGSHNDTIWGGDGDDQNIGGFGNDKLCDASGYDYCATNGGNYFDGGDGNDQIWYNESENPLVPCPNILMDLSSDAGTTGETSGDSCGDSNNYGQLQMPTGCDGYITVVPNKCDGAS